MKKVRAILNIFLVAIIAIGSIYIVYPETVLAQGTCSGCADCLGDECDQSSGTECGKIQNVNTEEIITCFKPGSGLPVE